MRRPIVVGNWKMNLNRQSAGALAQTLVESLATAQGVEIGVCPPAPYLLAVAETLRGSAILLGAQNVYHEKDGAFTGEVSTAMLTDCGCKLVILGHSERRQFLNETDQDVNRKLMSVLAAGLTPIVCVGENLAQRQANQTLQVIRQQFDGSLAGLTDVQMAATVLAYEPIWAIGTGVVASPQQAEEVHADLRRLIEKRYNSQIANQVRIQYGGSVKADNAASLMAQPNVDGALVGGASLQAEGFRAIITAAAVAGRG